MREIYANVSDPLKGGARGRCARDRERHRSDARFEPEAIEAMQHAAEAFIVERFQHNYRIANHFGRITLQVDDLSIVDDLCDK